ncbi:MAG: hypothetical protein KatS3mg007_0505 [Thermoanaerobaculum sp.]|nr:MAG: hypothetical protein KatS3mg007_0505 [Thermoanaerobaculum sp.]
MLPAVPGNRPARQHPAFIQTQFGLVEGDSLQRGWLGSFEVVSALLGGASFETYVSRSYPSVAFSAEPPHTAT